MKNLFIVCSCFLFTLAAVFGSLAPMAFAAPVNTVKLVEEAKATCVLILLTDAAPDEVLASKEIVDHLQKMSGAVPEVKRVAAAELVQVQRDLTAQKLTVILIGQAAHTPAMAANIRAKSQDAAAFAMDAGPGTVRLLGLSPEGTLFAAYELLEQLGVRWFMPGEIGTVIPTAKSVALPVQSLVQGPSFGGRWHGGNKFPEWAKRVRMGGPHVPPAHGILGTKAKDFATNPEWFALVNGVRSPKAKQLCVSNPEVVQRTIAATLGYFRKQPQAPWIGMGPNDGSGFCECDKCRALDSGEWDPFVNEHSITDRYIWFFNQVLEGIKGEFPTKKISFYSYHTYMRPPLKIIPNPLIVPQLAPITLCRVHGMNNPVCPERSYYKFLAAGWHKVVPVVYDRGYWFNLADPGFPFGMVHKMRDEIPAVHKLGIQGWRVETVNHWASETPSLYIAAKLMWNHEADVDALLDDFYGKFFGPAKAPMAKYFTLMDAAMRDGDFHTGCAFDMPHFYPAELRAEARKFLREGTALAGEGSYGQRVAVFQGSFDYLEAFIAMLADRDQHKFVEAKVHLERLDALQKSMIAHNPPLLNARAAPSYLRRFFRQPVEQGAVRVSNGNELVAAFKDEWSFQQDTQKIGEEIGLYRTDATGGNWQRIKTSSMSWSGQGLRTYKGEAWYRQSVEVPAKFEGKRVFLWFGGVDEKAKVWVNGVQVGISHGSAFLPFEMDATAAIKPGQTNVVSVRLINERIDELGTGGITAPVMFYAPAAGKDAVLENVRDLQPTFP